MGATFRSTAQYSPMLPPEPIGMQQHFLASGGIRNAYSAGFLSVYWNWLERIGSEFGGPGRTRTSNQTVMSAPMWRHAYFDFTEFLDGTAVLTNEMANDWRRSFPAIASTALRMCAGW